MESYAAGELEPPLLEETIGANFERTVAEHHDREALVDVASGRRWTRGRAGSQCRCPRAGAARRRADDRRPGRDLGAELRGSGCSSSSPPPSSASSRVNVNPAYRTHEFAYAVNRAGVRLPVSAESFKTSDYRAMVAETHADCPALERVVFIGTDDWTGLVASGADVPEGAVAERMAGLSPNDAINIQYTSGTTGRPKGATLSHRNILNNGYFVTELIDLGPDDRLCIPVPFYHCFGMVMGNLGCTSHGATMVIPAPGFDPEITLRTIATEKCTGVYGVPTMFIAMQNHPSFAEHDLSSLRTGIMAGSDLPGGGDEALRRRHAHVRGVHRLRHDRDLARLVPDPLRRRLDRRTSTIGRAHPHVEIKIVDPVTGEIVERGQPGEFCTRGYSVMLGYWEDPEKTAEAIDADGWMHTGDLAEMREDGYCNIVGRIKDMVIRGGENVYPREIEEFLYAHPDIEDVRVIGVPDEKYGEELCAWIKLKAGAAELDAAAIRAYADGRLAHYKIPRYVLLVDEFPMTVTGKIRKAEMREVTTERLGLGLTG
ncbi:AMP-binding protein [Nocardioides sp. B-3]|uniref:AMP-binding protein n=1 Tax=Nocardioides sp. B-3 TaxID=2895565 RepID=UPI0021527C9B|nr:AMP-binding protein [Nocardioides sp. B-3]UUZ58378.1 AMP-binding protein [Nocardioides sp. B-3]